MKTIKLTGPSALRLIDAQEPSLTSRESILVRTKALSICGTDSKIYSGDISTKKLPIVMGHEAGGVVQEKAPNVDGLDVGCKVLVDPNIADNTCNYCTKGLSNLCPQGGLMGRDEDGTFSELLELSSDRVYRIPPIISDDIIPLIQPLSTVVRGYKSLSLRPEDKVLILGVGATGLLFSQLCRLAGATVIGARRTWLDHVLRLSRDLGVDYCVDLTKYDLVKEVLSLTDGKGPNAIIITANLPQSISTSLNMISLGGTILQFFNYNGDASYNAYELYKKEARIISSRSSVKANFYDAIDLTVSGKISLEKLITQRYKLEEAEKAFAANEDRKQNLKVILTT